MIRESYHWSDWCFSLFPYDLRFWIKDFDLRKKFKISSWNLLTNMPNYILKASPLSNGELGYVQINRMLKYSRAELTLCLLSDWSPTRQLAEILMKR